LGKQLKPREAASGIVKLPENHQVHTVTLCKTPQLLHAIALNTSYPEVRKTALANASYPHPPDKSKLKRSEEILVCTR